MPYITRNDLKALLNTHFSWWRVTELNRSLHIEVNKPIESWIASEIHAGKAIGIQVIFSTTKIKPLFLKSGKFIDKLTR